ncbi:phospholipase D-like domain-containing protein [Leifsonia sp. Leaf264]|uniref:phospholipase D-like domain-containing protein n=1 Tax=Leifsonia sp. Leaf264 TaxID=1736314 RepID=UPI0006FADA92|nr:phospholipase D-like domain-containing protein [Leifsonia sp. Leaf264]KQO98711.1 hypothetical protein ASF30_11655 [Leifsonia sp. Leaf264]
MPRTQIPSLSELRPKPSARRRVTFDWEDRERGVATPKVISHFGDLHTPLEEFIRGSEAIVGCVAWITSMRLVDALASRPVSLIVNKEWALRSTDQNPIAVRNRDTLYRLTGGLSRKDFPAPLSEITGDDLIDPVRCVGAVSRSEQTPLMHHKFIVRLERGKPTAVWTGSFNFTAGADRNFENSVEIFDPKIAQSYLAEWARVAALSEPMEFAAGKADPDWTPPKPGTAAKPSTKAAAAKKPAPSGKDKPRTRKSAGRKQTPSRKPSSGARTRRAA